MAAESGAAKRTAPERESPALSMRDVGISYRRRSGFFRRDRFWAVRSVSFDVRPGETLGVIGRNGAGKSSLLRIMAGILRPEKGTVDMFGNRPSLLTIQAGFLKYLSGRENAILSGMLLGLRRIEVEERLGEIVDFSELEEKIDEPVYTYSTGMRARLGFSVALHAEPDILLLDEVLGVGDAEFREKSTAAMRDKLSSRRTVVLVSHNQQLIQDLCDRAVLLERGESVAEGTVEKVMEAYRRRRKTGTPAKAGGERP